MKDFNKNTDSVLLEDERDLIVQQIDILFDTNHGEVLGDLSFGADFYKFIWDLKVSNGDISQYAKQLILSRVNLFGWELKVDTKILEGTKNDIILVTILIKKNLTSFEKTYKIS